MENPQYAEKETAEPVQAATQEETKKQFDPKAVAFWNELTDEATNNYNEAFKQIIRSDEHVYGDTTYVFRMLNHKDLGKLKKLQAEKVKEDEDWDKYVANYRERAKLLIKDMDDAKFDEGDFYVIENLVTAWSIRASKGFRPLIRK